MEDLPARQMKDELRNATGQTSPGTASSRPRVSTGKLRMPSGRQQRSVIPAIRPRKVGANTNLRRLEGGPSRDTFDQLSSPERGKQIPKSKALLDGIISPRRDDTRNVVHQPISAAQQASVGAAPDLTAPNVKKAPHRSPRERINGSDLNEDCQLENAVRTVSSPVADKSSRALAYAVDSGSDVEEDVSDEHELRLVRQPSEGLAEGLQITETAATTKRKTRNSRSSKPVTSSAREPASGGAELSSPQVVIPAVKKIRPGSIFPLGDDITEAASGDEVVQRPRERNIGRRALDDHHEDHLNDGQQPAEPGTDRPRPVNKQSRKRKVVAPQATTKSRKTVRRAERAMYLGQNHELLGQQAVLRQVYQVTDKIGWSYKEGKKHVRREVDLDDEQVVSVKRLCREAKSKLSELKALPDDQEITSDPPEEFSWICDEVRALATKEEYFGDRNKVNNIYFHLFTSLLKLLRDTIDCYGELDKGEDELTPQRSITIYHLGVVTSLLRPITSLYDALDRQYCEPSKGLCIKQPVNQIIVALRLVQDRFVRELRRHRDKQQQKLDDEARAEADRLLEERHEREEAIAEQRAQIREKWLRLHDERRHVDANILPRWKIAHLRVPELEPDRDGDGEPFERLEIFAPRIGPSLASTEKARQVEWNAIELDALRTGLEEFAGPRLFVKIFRRYCTRGGPLHRFNVTEIVTIAADMVQWEEARQRKSGSVDEWVREVKQYMWTKAKIQGSGQENNVDVD